jgi:hypothetical protein
LERRKGVIDARNSLFVGADVEVGDCVVDELRMSEIACTILLKYGSYSSWILIEKHFDKL